MPSMNIVIFSSFIEAVLYLLKLNCKYSLQNSCAFFLDSFLIPFVCLCYHFCVSMIKLELWFIWQWRNQVVCIFQEICPFFLNCQINGHKFACNNLVMGEIILDYTCGSNTIKKVFIKETGRRVRELTWLQKQRLEECNCWLWR